MDSHSIEEKEHCLRVILKEMGSVVIGFSGGVDSTLLGVVANQVLGNKALCVIGDSESLLDSEFEEAQELARSFGLNYRVIKTRELSDPNYARNPENRCFFCKNELFGLLSEIASGEGFRFVADGSNRDDLGDHRPGMEAASKYSVRHPLQEAGFTKDDIRELAKRLGLPNWDKPALACLASRFPYGTNITAQKLAMVACAEEALKALGFRGFRVRHHEAGSDTIARIEIAQTDFRRILDPETRARIDKEIRAAGYHYVTLDLQGYRRGRLNESIGRGLVQVIAPSKRGTHSARGQADPK